MPPHTVSLDLKARIPVLYRPGGRYSVTRICHLLGIKKTLVYKTIKLTGTSPQNANHGLRGRRRNLSIDDIAFLTTILRRNPTMYLDELQHELRARRGVFVSVHTLFRTLHRLQYSHKSISARALERDEERHAIFMNNIAEIAPDREMLMLIVLVVDIHGFRATIIDQLSK
jgi:transposase